MPTYNAHYPSSSIFAEFFRDVGTPGGFEKQKSPEQNRVYSGVHRPEPSVDIPRLATQRSTDAVLLA